MAKKSKERERMLPGEIKRSVTHRVTDMDMDLVKAALEIAQNEGVTVEVVFSAITYAQEYPHMEIRNVLTLAKGEWIK